jgi:hypothetical protein
MYFVEFDCILEVVSVAALSSCVALPVYCFAAEDSALFSFALFSYCTVTVCWTLTSVQWLVPAPKGFVSLASPSPL